MQELVNGILEKVAQLKILWSLLSKITVAAEQPSFDGASLNSLEGLTIDFNIFWRNTFGMLFSSHFGGLTRPIGKPACTYKIHKMLHLADSIRNCGPLRYTWVFPFERGNVVAARSIHRLDRAFATFAFC
jgi:hypothetical protein